MTAGHFADGITEFQPDPGLVKKAAETIAGIKANCDIVIPGHDNLIII
jgi:hypothetical protein